MTQTHNAPYMNAKQVTEFSNTAITSVTCALDRPLVQVAGSSRRHLQVTLQAQQRPSQQRPPLHIAFVVDRSGSMSGGKLDLALRGVLDCIGLLTATDYFSIVSFDNEIAVEMAHGAATPQRKREAETVCRGIDARGGTNLSDGWAEGCRQLDIQLEGQASRLCLLLTDGQANEGITDHRQLQTLVANVRRMGVTTSCVGIGANFAEELLKGMADAADGRFYFARTARELQPLLAGEVGEALEVVASQVEVRLHVPPAVRVTALGGFRTVNGAAGPGVAVGSLTAGQQLTTVFALDTREASAGTEVSVQVEVRATETGLLRATPVTLRWAEAAEVDGQIRDIDVVRAAAEQYAAEARLEAVEANRNGNFSRAQAVLHEMVARVLRMADGDRALLMLADELEREAREFAHRLDAMSLKEKHSLASYMTKGRSRMGTSLK